jgi:hypothetical protein
MNNGHLIWLFAGSDAGGKRAATIYTILQTAALNSLDPEAHLREVLAGIADHPINQIGQLLPWNWAANQAAWASTQKAAQDDGRLRSASGRRRSMPCVVTWPNSVSSRRKGLPMSADCRPPLRTSRTVCPIVSVRPDPPYRSAP